MSQLSERQRRTYAIADLDVRASDEGEAPRIVGYAARFNEPSEIIADFSGVYREIIAPGAFTRSLNAGADVRALVNHNPDFVLGRTKSETLTLREDSKGLWYEIMPPDTQWARDLLTTMRRGDIDQSSFAFRVIKDEWRKGKTADGTPIDERTVLEAQLFDASPVTYPAYTQTTSAVRALLGDVDLDAFIQSCRALPAAMAELRTLLDRYSAPPVPAPAPGSHVVTATTDPAPEGYSAADVTPIDPHRAARLRARLVAVERLTKGA